MLQDCKLRITSRKLRSQSVYKIGHRNLTDCKVVYNSKATVVIDECRTFIRLTTVSNLELL